MGRISLRQAAMCFVLFGLLCGQIHAVRLANQAADVNRQVLTEFHRQFEGSDSDPKAELLWRERKHETGLSDAGLIARIVNRRNE